MSKIKTSPITPKQLKVGTWVRVIGKKIMGRKNDFWAKVKKVRSSGSLILNKFTKKLDLEAIIICDVSEIRSIGTTTIARENDSYIVVNRRGTESIKELKEIHGNDYCCLDEFEIMFFKNVK